MKGEHTEDTSSQRDAARDATVQSYAGWVSAMGSVLIMWGVLLGDNTVFGLDILSFLCVACVVR